MHTEDEYSKFTRSLSKLLSSQWSKVIGSSSKILNSEKNIDQLLEEEYETLLREIDYLASEKSCYLSFKNDHFHTVKSSADLAKVLKKHSSEVLRNYIKQHDTTSSASETLNNKTGLINYVTEIVVSRHKCNNKLCTCKPVKVSKEVLTDNSIPEENRKETQTSKSKDNLLSKAINNPSEIDQKGSQIKSSVKKTDTKDVQTNDSSHDPNCTCEWCPKNPPTVDTKNVVTDSQKVQDATTSDRKITESKNILTNCLGENVETNTSVDRICVSQDVESLVKKSEAVKFSACTSKKDCACDAYDAKEALKRGIILPSSEVCIQNKKDQKIKNKKKEKAKKKKKVEDTTSDGNETSSDVTSTSSDNNKKKKKEKKANKNKSKEKKQKKQKISDSDESSSSTSPRGTSKKHKEETTGCFGKKRKGECDEYCQGVVPRHRSMQTIPITTQDKNEEVFLYGKNDRKAIQTSTDSEIGIQVSAHPSAEDTRKKNKQDRETWPNTTKKEDRGMNHSPIIKNKSSFKESAENLQIRQSKEKVSKEKQNDTAVCNKCGKHKRECTSGCRNTIVIPYASGSNRTIPAGDADSLRMLIKMQSKDTNRQFDNIMSELTHQKSEIRRLNDMYQKMLENFYQMQKYNSPSSSKSHNKKPSDISRECGCINFSASKRSEDTARECGCSFSNECKSTKTQPRSNNDSYGSGGNNSNGGALKRFGPPNTAVAINLCDTCNVEITRNTVKSHYSPRECDYVREDKHRKNQLNNYKKAEDSDHFISSCENNKGATGDASPHKTDSVSTIYKDDKKYKRNTSDSQMVKSPGHENLFHGKEPINEEVATDDTSEPGKRPKGKYSSRVILWLKKSWISIKHKSDECRNKNGEGIRWSKGKDNMQCILNFCQGKAKHAATGMWKSLKKARKQF